MRSFKILTAAGFLLSAAALSPGNAAAAPSVQAWVQRFNSPDNGDDVPMAIALGPEGNLYVTGYSPGGGSTNRWLLISYSSSGTPLWTNAYAGPLLGTSACGGPVTYSGSLAVDRNSGFVYVTGSVRVSNYWVRFETTAFSSLGVPLWTNQCAPNYYPIDFVYALAVDRQGDVYVEGNTQDCGEYCCELPLSVAYSGMGVPLWTNIQYAGSGGPLRDLSAGEDLVYVTRYPTWTVAWSKAGVQLWARDFILGAYGANQATGTAVDHRNGNFYVTGWYREGISYMYFRDAYTTIAYASTGIPLWTNLFKGATNETRRATAIAVGPEGNVYVTGYAGVANYDWATVAYSGTGTGLWTNWFGNLNYRSEYAEGIAAGPDGNVYVKGTSYDAAQGAYVLTTIAYSSTGTPLWTNLNSPVSSFPLLESRFRLAVGPNGAVYVAAPSPAVHGGVTNADFVVVKYVTTPAIRFTDAAATADGRFRLTLAAPNSTSFGLESSPDFWIWQPLVTFSNLAGTSAVYFDPVPINATQRFYRARWLP